MARTEIPGKNTPERNAIAAQLLKSRKFDLNKEHVNYGDNSGLYQYIAKLMGVTEFLKYVRELEKGGVMLDIGAGTTNAASQLANHPFGEGLDIRATSLRRHKLVGSRLGNERMIKTSAERLAGIEDESVSGIIGFSSISYSASPDSVARSFNRVLVKGGVAKMGEFADGERAVGNTPGSHRYPPDEFVQAFRTQGFDVAMMPRNYWHLPIMLSIKPGGPEGVTAQGLLEAEDFLQDLRDYHDLSNAA